MNLENSRKVRDWRKFAIWFTYTVLTVFLFTRHENWRDEAQAWLLARDLDIPGLIRQMSYEGHPCLWHLLLMPFAKLGLPYHSMNILSVSITSAAAALMLWKSPIPLFFQIFNLAGISFLYYMPVVSRSYCLIPIILFMNACWYGTRREKPFRYGLSIALLVQTHVFMLCMAGMMSLFWFREAIANYKKDRNRRTLACQAGGLMLPLLSLVFFLMQISGAQKSSAFGIKGPSPRRLLNCTLDYFRVNWSGVTLGLAGLFMIAMFALLTMVIRKKNGKALVPLLIFAFGVGFQIVFKAMIYGAGRGQKCAPMCFMLIWMIWVAWPYFADIKLKGAALTALCVVCALNVLNLGIVVKDVHNVFSDGENCADFINDNIPEDALLFTTSDPHTSAVLPDAGIKGYHSLELGECISFTTWIDMEPQIRDMEALRAYANTVDAGAEEVYILIPKTNTNVDMEPFREYLTEENCIYETAYETLIGDEFYRIYRISIY